MRWTPTSWGFIFACARCSSRRTCRDSPLFLIKDLTMARVGKIPRLKKKGKKPGKEAPVASNSVKGEAVKTETVENKRPENHPSKEIQAKKEPAEQSGAQKSDFAGLIFMCNTSTKQDCFKYRVFGLPEAKKHLVEQVTRGMRLFLFDIDRRLLYGIYRAASRGGFNLQADAFKASKKAFPWQVRFTVFKDCLPLPEDVFKKAIKENYDDNRKFKIELNGEQVQKLVKLFRPIPRDNGPAGPPPHRTLRVPSRTVPRPVPLNRYEAPPKVNKSSFPVRERRLQGQMYESGFAADDYRLAREARLRREAHLHQYSANSGVPEYIPAPASVPAYVADPVPPEVELRRTDSYQIKDNLFSAYPHLGKLAVEAGSLYRQKHMQVPDVRGEVLDRRMYGLEPMADGSSSYPGISSEMLRKRPYEDALLDDRGHMFLSKRHHMQEELLHRSLDYQRRLPYEEGAIISGPARNNAVVPLTRQFIGGGW